MANTLGVCLLALSLFCCTNLSSARQVPKECSKGPSYWCQSLRKAADCGAAGHCISTVWEQLPPTQEITQNGVSETFVRLFRELKDVKDLINDEYLGTRVASACRDIEYEGALQLCKENTAKLEVYLSSLLLSNVSPETMCSVIQLCNNDKLDHIISLNGKKNTVVPNVHKGSASDKSGSPVTQHLLGSKKCTWGPSYWCSNFSTGRECKATQHCITRVWSKMDFPEDNDGVCKICLDMVKQARDQLESNETQTELKQVFEGSCKLIPLKVVAKECIKMADDFVPELVETLASQMNPQAVCSVAGLCNNARIDELLERYAARSELRQQCTNCHMTVSIMRKRFDASNDEDLLVGMLKMCRFVGSLSDSCSMLVFKYYTNIIEALKHDLVPQNMCLLSGQCAYKYHEHDEMSFAETNTKEYTAKDNVPCEFCEQLVLHLRDTLVANTTELQFEKVLKGLCKATGSFKDECLSIVNQYYAEIYKFLVSELKPAEICATIGICEDRVKLPDVPIAPLLPQELSVRTVPSRSSQLIGGDEARIARIALEKDTNVRTMDPTPGSVPPPLPLERMFVGGPQHSKPLCSFCQYFLHYLQVEISDMRNEERVKEAVEKACDRLPKSVDDECRQFVTEYGPAVIAVLVQEIDPSSVCPALRLCPEQEIKRVQHTAKPSYCPLCLFAVEQMEVMLENNRTKENIKSVLNRVCDKLSTKLEGECRDFVTKYSEELIELLIANLNSQEICTYLNLCKNDNSNNPLKLHPSIEKYHEKPHLMADRNNRRKPMLPKHMLAEGGDIETNEIPDNTVGGRPVKAAGPDTVCVVCEFVLKQIDDEIKDKHNEDEIKKVVHSVCKRMPKSVRAECDQFVEKYADLVISLLAQELDPDEVCERLKLCRPTSLDYVKEEILDCAVCEAVAAAVKKVITNDAVDRNIVHIVEKSCGLLPAKYSARCHTMMEIYGDSVIHLIEQYGTKQVCAKIGLCSAQNRAYLHMQQNPK